MANGNGKQPTTWQGVAGNVVNNLAAQGALGYALGMALLAVALIFGIYRLGIHEEKRQAATENLTVAVSALTNAIGKSEQNNTRESESLIAVIREQNKIMDRLASVLQDMNR